MISCFSEPVELVVPLPISCTISLAAEGLAILALRSRVQAYKNVCGISGNSLCLILLIIFLRVCDLPTWQLSEAQLWGATIMDIISFAMLADVARSMYSKYADSYDKHVDCISWKYIAATCSALVLMHHPQSPYGLTFTARSTAVFYLDVFVFLPQVVIMARQSSHVQSPIAYYVVVTAIAKLSDLLYWLDAYDVLNNPSATSLSGWLIICLHIASLLVVSDFFYYYVRSLMIKPNLEQDDFIVMPQCLDE